MRTKLNLEIASVDAMVRIACRVRPRDVCLVPERREELTTEGGLDVVANKGSIGAAVDALRAAGIRVSLFIDPEEAQIEATRGLGAEVVELHTGAYADAPDEAGRVTELERIRRAAVVAAETGLIVNAGHGLTVDNVDAIAAIPELFELNIGHSLVADAVFIGLEAAVRRMKERVLSARASA